MFTWTFSHNITEARTQHMLRYTSLYFECLAVVVVVIVIISCRTMLNPFQCYQQRLTFFVILNLWCLCGVHYLIDLAYMMVQEDWFGLGFRVFRLVDLNSLLCDRLHTEFRTGLIWISFVTFRYHFYDFYHLLLIEKHSWGSLHNEYGYPLILWTTDWYSIEFM